LDLIEEVQRQEVLEELHHSLEVEVVELAFATISKLVVIQDLEA